MKKILVLLLLMVFSTSLFAETNWDDWSPFESNDDLIAYAELKGIKRKGNKVYMRTLGDYFTVQQFENYKYLSVIETHEFDCVENTSRKLNIFMYSGNKGIGEVVYSELNIKEESHSIISHSFSETFFGIACSVK